MSSSSTDMCPSHPPRSSRKSLVLRAFNTFARRGPTHIPDPDPDIGTVASMQIIIQLPMEPAFSRRAGPRCGTGRDGAAPRMRESTASAAGTCSYRHAPFTTPHYSFQSSAVEAMGESLDCVFAPCGLQIMLGHREPSFPVPPRTVRSTPLGSNHSMENSKSSVRDVARKRSLFHCFGVKKADGTGSRRFADGTPLAPAPGRPAAAADLRWSLSVRFIDESVLIRRGKSMLRLLQKPGGSLLAAKVCLCVLGQHPARSPAASRCCGAVMSSVRRGSWGE